MLMENCGVCERKTGTETLSFRVDGVQYVPPSEMSESASIVSVAGNP